MINEIIVKSRKEMKRTFYSIDKPSIVISIRDPEKEPECFCKNPNVLSILYLDFEDWDRPEDGCQLISDEQADRIADLVLQYADKLEVIDLYVNCEAGVSRSAGVAAAVARALDDDDEKFFRIYYPNRFVYRKVLEALYNKMNE